MSDKTWTDAQDIEFINVLSGVKNVIQNMSTQMFVMLDLFQQYVDGVYSSPVFAGAIAVQETENGQVRPTQTSAPAGPTPANRAEKRAAKKSGLIIP